jgi:diguanylate cyclase (GGDEF)-like protein
MTDLSQLELGLDHDVVAFLPAEDGAIDLTTCDREPIHLSGAIQPHGVLLTIREVGMSVERASANTRLHLGIDPADILGAPLAKTLGLPVADRLRDALADVRASGTEPLLCHLVNGRSYDLTWHRQAGVVVIELEPTTADAPVSMSTVFRDVQHSMETLQVTEGVQALCDAAAREVKHLTGYDRVMVYRFHPDEHGEVVAEQCEPEQEPFLGLNYPASDIPRQARKLYLLNHLRVIADVAYRPVPLLALSDMDAVGLDLSLSGLRSVSPIHLAYLTNMGVGATLTISLMHGTRLWGMLACHHRAPKRIDAQVRAACRVLGQVFSLQLVAQENQERHAYRVQLAEIEVQLVSRMSAAESLADALLASNPLPLQLTAADSIVARIDGQLISSGAAPPAAAVEALITRLCAGDEPSALVCEDLPHRFPELAPYAATASGVIAVPLSAGYEDFILWFRGEQVRQLAWAGDPDKAMSAKEPDPSGVTAFPTLSPRLSFESWAQEVRGRCEPWQAAEVETARGLAASIPELLLSRVRDRLAHLALHDALTGLPNRSLLLDRATQAFARQQRNAGQVAFLFIDLDRFKSVNDAFGHASGDNLLRQAGQRLTAVVRDGDTVARIGGDEFVVLCESVSALAALQLAERIVSAFRKPFTLDSREALITTSVGIALTTGTTSPAELLRDADTAMYRAKRSGRNAAAPFTPEMRAITLRRIEIETSLRPALERGELVLNYQPIHRIAGGVTGFEALARWPLLGRGLVPPSEFIPVAEATGVIADLTDWVLEEGLRSLAGWRRARPELNLTLAVNVVASQLTNDTLQNTIDGVLKKYRLPSASLALEITETELVADDPLSRRSLRRLREQGIRLSIDDFGTGFSSLAYLTKLPMHELKVDQAFVAGLPSSQSDVAVVASVVALAHQLGLQVLAEGVENDDQLATVRRLGCDLVQGYLLGRPMPAAEIDRYLAVTPLAAA